MRLEHVRRFRVQRRAIASTTRTLREAGRAGHERFVLWSGRIDGDTFVVHTVHVPEQTAYKTKKGLLVRVEGEALHRLNMWLYEHEEILAVQVHAHPTDAFHSDTDDTYPIVTTLGGLSIVAADFARDGLLTSASATYRLSAAGWQHVPLAQVGPLVEVFD